MRRQIMAVATAAALLVSSAGTSLASSGNGELCAVQSYDESVVVSVHAWPYTPATAATRAQIDDAAGWCTNQIAAKGWMPASKYYDDYTGQTSVCWVHGDADRFVIFVHASPDSFGTAADACTDIQGGKSLVEIGWWP